MTLEEVIEHDPVSLDEYLEQDETRESAKKFLDLLVQDITSRRFGPAERMEAYPYIRDGCMEVIQDASLAQELRDLK